MIKSGYYRSGFDMEDYYYRSEENAVEYALHRRDDELETINSIVREFGLYYNSEERDPDY